MKIEINQFNLNSGLFDKYKNALFSNAHWHKIVVENVQGLERDAVLKIIMKFCHPLHFIPVSYEVPSTNTATFLIKNCGPAIERMCTQNLIIINPDNNDRPLKISIQVCFATASILKINIQENVMNVLNKRFNQETGVLNLESFHEDSDLEEYTPLSQPKLLFYILHLARNMAFKYLKLSNNDIENLKPMHALVGGKTLTAIDLRNNNVKQISEINYMKDLNITELWLDGNPICDDYDEFSYGKAIKEVFKKLAKLDGVNMQLKGFLPFRRNFLCCQTGYDLVDQFLEHYFTLYDSHNRSILDGIYHKDALMSLTTTYLSSQSTFATARLTLYKNVSRNLKQIVDFSKNIEFLFTGPYEILKVLTTLPPSEHDPFSFTVDLVMYTEKIAVLVVTGVFREVARANTDIARLLGFTRTFVLLACENGQYSIINEMIHITNATNTQAKRAFKHVRIPAPKHINIPQPQNEKEMTEMAVALNAVSGLNMKWAQKCLEECKYDLKRTLVLFVDLLKLDKIPNSAFGSSSDGTKADIEEKDLCNSNIQALVNQPHQLSNTQQAIQPVASQMGNIQQINQAIPPNLTVGNVHPLNVQGHAVPHMQQANPPKPTVPFIQQVNPPRPTVPPMQQVNPSRPIVPPMHQVNHPRPMVPPMHQVNHPIPMVPPMHQVNHPRSMVPPMHQVNHPRSGVPTIINMQPLNPPRPRMQQATPPKPTVPFIRQVNPPRPTVPPMQQANNPSRPIVSPMHQVNHQRSAVPTIINTQPLNPPIPMRNPHPFNPPTPMVPPHRNMQPMNLPRPVVPTPRNVQINHPMLGNIQAVFPSRLEVSPEANMQNLTGIHPNQLSPSHVINKSRNIKKPRIGSFNVLLKK